MFNYAGIPMPGAVPGVSSPLPSRVQPVPSPIAAINPGSAGPLPPAISGAIRPALPPPPGTAPTIPAPPSPHPGDHGWAVEPQSDGTLLLRIKMADGKPGPVVKIISGIKVPGAEQ